MRRLLAIVLCLVAPPLARAADAPPVYLEIDPCTDTDPAGVKRHAALELHARLLDAPDRAAIHVHLGCDAGQIVLTTDDPRTSVTHMRRFDLTLRQRTGRDRLLALAVVELVDAASNDADAPDDDPGIAVTPSPSAIDAVRRADDWSLSAAASMRLSRSPAALGAGLTLWHRFGPHWVAAVDVVIDTSADILPLYGVDNWFVSTHPRFGMRLELGRELELEGMIGLRAGAARMQGTPSMPGMMGQTQTSPWGGPAFSGYVRAGKDPVVLMVGVELGYVVVGSDLVSGGSVLSSVSGPWFGGLVSFAVVL